MPSGWTCEKFLLDGHIPFDLPFSDFTLGYRGRTLSGPPLDRSSIERMGFLLADGQAGDFCLHIKWIAVE